MPPKKQLKKKRVDPETVIITANELAQHNQSDNAWVSIDSKVVCSMSYLYKNLSHIL